MKQRLAQYRSKAGEYHHQWYPIGDQPPDVVEVGDVVYELVKLPELAARGQGLQVVGDSRPVVSSSSPRWHGKGTKAGAFYRNYTKEGKPVIDSRATLREAQLRAGDHGETITRLRDYGASDE